MQLSANFRLYSSISEQIENLVAGFYEIIPKELITIVSHVTRRNVLCFTGHVAVQRTGIGTFDLWYTGHRCGRVAGCDGVQRIQQLGSRDRVVVEGAEVLQS